jgi:hypothetical protein
VFLTLACLALVLGCGDEEDPAPLAPVENPEQMLGDNLAQMNMVTDAAENEPANQILEDQTFEQLLAAVGFDALGPVASVIRDGVSATDRAAWERLGVQKLRPAVPRLAMLEGAGTYDRDVNDVSEPFPGWVQTEPNDPSNGFVFRFQLDDGVSYWDEEAMAEVPVHGEFRLLEVVFEDNGTPVDPVDDYLEHLVIEVAASPEASVEAPTLARLELAVVVTSQSLSWTIGSATANNPGDSGASFIGPVLFHARLAVTQTTVEDASFEVTEQLYHSVERFAARVELAQTVNLQSETLTSARFVLGAGETNNPSVPPLRLFIELSKFRMEGLNEVADVSGSITYNLAPLASFSGDTSEVPVDFDGDGTIDGMCVNINVTFADNPVPQNICTVGELEDSILPF